jgi:hypothetical protein
MIARPRPGALTIRVIGAVGLTLVALPGAALAPEVLSSVRSLSPDISGRFREPRAYQQSAFGQYYVFDRRGHTVYGVDEAQTGSWQIVHIGAEPGRLLQPSSLAVAADGTFAVADAPGGQERVQIFSPVGFRIAGFVLPGRTRPRVTFEDVVLNGIASLQYTGKSVFMSQPETGSLVIEYSISGRPLRTFGTLRQTGHEQDRDVHLALNSGIPLIDPLGGFYFVFQAGVPMFRKFDEQGRLLFERHLQGREIDPLVAGLPTTWQRREGELPLIRPSVRTAAVAPDGSLWIALVGAPTYVFDRDGDKIRVVQFRGAGPIAPDGFFFGPRGRLLVTPGLYEFDTAPRPIRSQQP